MSMNYACYFLHFATPVHFGCGERGEGLAQGTLTYHADTLFSALCTELAVDGQSDEIAILHDLAASGSLLFSDLFPYCQVEEETEPYLYLPKPLLPAKEEAFPQTLTYPKAVELADKEKRFRQTRYLRVSEIADYIKAIKGEDSFTPDSLPLLGRGQVVTHVNQSQDISQPYYVYEFTFAKQAGLYGILAYENEEDKKWFLHLLQMLGLSGIGGRRSSGYGKFSLWQDPVAYQDKIRLSVLLQHYQAPQYMALSSVLPAWTELKDTEAGQYMLLKRSGFLTPEGGAIHKRKNIYMLAAGSCFPKKIAGTIADVSIKDPHPVWRYGKGLYVGLML